MIDLSRRRTRYDIYLDVLETLRRRGACPITRISYGAGIPVDRAKKIVKFLESRGLLKEENIGGKKLYRITGRGGEFLDALRIVKFFIG